MKLDKPPDEWLLFIYSFIQRCDHLARLSKGTLVKRIGDEVMLTFDQASEAESFIESLVADPALNRWGLKK